MKVIISYIDSESVIINHDMMPKSFNWKNSTLFKRTCSILLHFDAGSSLAILLLFLHQSNIFFFHTKIKHSIQKIIRCNCIILSFDMVKSIKKKNNFQEPSSGPFQLCSIGGSIHQPNDWRYRVFTTRLSFPYPISCNCTLQASITFCQYSCWAITS